MQELDRGLPEPATTAGRRPVQWVLVNVTEAYIHCSKHIPKLIPQSRVRHWGTDNPRYKGGDYFGAIAQNQAGLDTDPVPTETVPTETVPTGTAAASSLAPDRLAPGFSQSG
jgi:hypothetical protein